MMAFAALLGVASCDVESSNNGNFDGMWHITEIDTLATGGVYDLSLVRRFWNVDTHLLELRDYEGVVKFLIARFELSSNRLIISRVYLYDREGGDPEITNEYFVQPYGMWQIPDTFDVEKLEHYKMTLKSKKYRIYFEKY